MALGSVSIIPQSGDTLLHADTLRVQPSIAALLTGTIRLNQVEGSGILLQLVHKKNSTNYKFASDEKKAEKICYNYEIDWKEKNKLIADLLQELINKQKESKKDV